MPQTKDATSAGFSDRLNRMPTPMPISTSPKRTSHMAASWERKLAIWLMEAPSTVGCPAAIGLMTVDTKPGLNSFGWNFRSAVDDPQDAQGELQGALVDVESSGQGPRGNRRVGSSFHRTSPLVRPSTVTPVGAFDRRGKRYQSASRKSLARRRTSRHAEVRGSRRRAEGSASRGLQPALIRDEPASRGAARSAARAPPTSVGCRGCRRGDGGTSARHCRDRRDTSAAGRG